MSNPFDDGADGGAPPRQQQRGGPPRYSHAPSPPRQQQQRPQNRQYGGAGRQNKQSYYNPPPSPSRRSYNDNDMSISQQWEQQASNAQQSQQQQPIFSARGVEWPLPSAFNPGQYRKWRRESRSLGVTLGIMSSGLRIGGDNNILGGSSGVGGASTGGNVEGENASVGGGNSRQGADHHSAGSLEGGGSSTTSTGGANNPGGGYGGLTGLMGRVLGANSTSATGLTGGMSNDIEEEDLNISATRPVLPPRPRCVASSNGWIVAVVECGNFPSATSSSGGGMMQQSNNKHALTSLIPPLRLVSRWNVRRGTSLVGSEGNYLVPLPPPVRPVGAIEDQHIINNAPHLVGAIGNSDPNFGQMAHVFVDPTGCHVLLSARNGEAYYLHSTSKKVRKLNGFGPNVDGSYTSAGSFKPGVSLGEANAAAASADASGGETSVAVQTGLTPGSYVTAVGWDRDRGTEGSTKRILLGTSYGELYEYSLVSPNASSASSSPSKATKSSLSSPFDAKAGELGMLDDDYYGEAAGGESDPVDAPVLLHRMSANGSGSDKSGGVATVGAVGGILFQRIMGGAATPTASGGSGLSAGGYVIVLVSTGGMHRHTRLHTFRSDPLSIPPSPSAGTFGGGAGGGASSHPLALRSAFSRSSHFPNVIGGGSTVVELPGSVDFSELRVCNTDGGSFALRTETGIYYGTIERMVSGGVSLAAGSGSGGIVDAGMLTYDSLHKENSSGGSSTMTIPSSIGLTPHHFITLSSSTANTNNDAVRFINRVGRRVIQEERVDWASVSSSSQTSSLDGDFLPYGGVAAALTAELIADIRRPDQIWLRRGRSLVHISSMDEDRDEWKFTLARCIETAASPHYNASSMHHHGSGPATTRVIHDTSGTASPLTSEEKHIDSQFEYAKSLCRNSSQVAVVNAVRAEYHLSKGRAELAAKYMAQCPPEIMSFADTSARLALPMLEGRGKGSGGGASLLMTTTSAIANEALSNSNMALITYLCDKMKVAKSKNDAVVCTMLGTWLTELHLQERENGSRSGSSSPAKKRSVSAPPPVNHALLHQFLSSFVRDMDSGAIINVLSSHDISAGECAGYSAAAGDIGAAIDAALSGEDEKNGALDALRVLNDSPIEKAEPYYYKYALTLLSRAPMSSAKSFVARYTEGLSDTKLLPAFMHYEQRRKNEHASRESAAIENTTTATFVDNENASIRYMEGVIKLGSQSRAVYNYLTSLYASMQDEEPLFRFLSAHVSPATTTSTAGGVSNILLKQATEERKCLLDKSYALRTILRTGRHYRSAVKLYMGFGMRQQAVELALKVDPSLARELARQSDDKEETKRLWLMIARNAAANGGTSSSRDGKDVVARVVMVLKDCGPDILSIEDVLPFLPDFAQIDQFKDEICDALASYSSKIEHYLKEMNDCDQACDALRDELSRLKTTGTQVRANSRCAFTNKHVLSAGEPFYAFPSGYVVLETALKREVIPYLNEKQLERVKFIENELSRLRRSQSNSSGKSSYEIAKDEYEMEELQVELDGLIAAECPLTGSIMVESIDHGFSGDDEDDEFA